MTGVCVGSCQQSDGVCQLCCSVLQCVAVCCSVLCVGSCQQSDEVCQVVSNMTNMTQTWQKHDRNMTQTWHKHTTNMTQTWHYIHCGKACQMMQCVKSCHSDGVCQMMWVAECTTGSCQTWIVLRHVKWCCVLSHVTMGVCQLMWVVECITPWALACITSLRASSSH